MTLAETYSWIFYAAALASKNGPVKLSAIEPVADGINHAIPTQKELQLSMSWCISEKLIQKVGKSYSLTQNGTELLESCSKTVGTTMGVWKNIEDCFVTKGADNSKNVNPATLTT